MSIPRQSNNSIEIDNLRRKLLKSVAALCVYSMPPTSTLLVGAHFSTADLDFAHSKLLQLLQNHYAAAEVGRAVIQSGLLPANRSVLMSDLFTKLGLAVDDVTNLHEQALTGLYLKRVMFDFDNGDTLTVMGWVLSRTEALLTAAKALD